MKHRKKKRVGLALAAVLFAGIGFGCAKKEATAATSPPSQSVSSPAATLAATRPAVAEVRLKTSDGWTLAGDLYIPQDATKGAVVLLHQRGGSAKEWQPLCAALSKEGVTALAIDQRGAGRSTKGPGQTGDNAPWNTQSDITAALDSLPPGQKAALVGASYGANNALIYANAHPHRVKGVVLFSPGTNYNGLDTLAPAKTYRGPVLLFHARGDTIAGDGPERIHEADPANRPLTLIEGNAHGTSLLNSESIHKTVTFLDGLLH